jgi:hypothetical protein
MKTEKLGKEKCFVDRFFNFFHHLVVFPLSLVPTKHHANNCSDPLRSLAAFGSNFFVVLRQ